MMDLYRTMLTIRLLEEELLKLSDAGEVSDLHLNKGQEAIAVGTCAALRSTDYIVVHHRTIAHAVAKGVPLVPLVAEILGKASGLCGGRAGEMHLSYPPARFLFSFQLVGTCVPVAAGLAWAIKAYRKSGDIVAAFHGDAATSNAQWHEGMNLAAVLGVPLLLLCENNGLAGNVRSPYYLPVKRIAQRAAGYGVEATTIDGNDARLVRDTAREVSEYVRHKSRPYLVECLTTRLSWHKLGQRDVRPREEVEDLAQRDPLELEARRLNMAGEVRQLVYDEVRSEVLKAIAAAREGPVPTLAQLIECQRIQS